MTLSISGPKRPVKAKDCLEVLVQKSDQYEGLFEDIAWSIKNISSSEGFSNENIFVYNQIWSRIFKSFTGEKLSDCVNLWLLSERTYSDDINGIFGSFDRFKEFTGFYPDEVVGINVEGSWILYKEKKDLTVIPDVFHEIGHRVYSINSNRYISELGANYFMFLCIKKLRKEFEGIGTDVLLFDYSKVNLTEDHVKSIRRAEELVKNNEKYIHGETK